MAERCIIAGVAALLSFAVLFTGCEAECGFPALVEAQFGQTRTLSSLNYPQDYSNNLNCGCKITAGWNYVVRLSVTALDLEAESDCNYDRLSVYDAGSEEDNHRLAKLCGKRLNVPDIYSTGRYMYIKFKTDESITGQGFQLQYTVVTRPSNTTTTITPRPNCCGTECALSPATLTAPHFNSKLLFSPNYPQDYSNNLDCRWKITAADGRHVIRLTVNVLDLEEESTCDYDSLSVYDADSLQSSRLLAKLCGIQNNALDMYSTGRYMYIKFTTDESITSQGFKLQYMAVSTSSSCGLSTYLHASFGQSKTMTSPNYAQNYFNNMDCGWKITADWNYVVRLHVTALDLEEEPTCAYDSLSVYDADSEQDVHHLAKLCGRQNNLPYIYSTGRYMYIKFRTDGSETRTGFQLQYTAARHSEIVPWTTTTSALWDTFTTTTASAPYVSHHIGALIGGLTAAFVLLFLVVCCGWYLRMRSKKQRPPVACLFTAAPNPTPGSLVMCPNTSSAYVLPSSQPNFNGNLNMAYTPNINGPPLYFVPQHNFIQGTAAASCIPNIPATASPMYDQAMMTSHPPSKGTSVGAPPSSVHMGTDLPPDAVAACPTSPPDQREAVPRSVPDCQ